MTFYILIKNNFMEVSSALLLGFFLVITTVLFCWGLLSVSSLKQQTHRFIRAFNIYLLFVLLVVVIFGTVFVYQRYVHSTTFHKAKKVIVIAIGGATWKVITPLLKENALPHIANFMQNGSYGVLKSLEYMASAVTWASGATGSQPEKHGISTYGYSSKEYQIKPFWEMAEQYGMSIGVFGYLTDWPPKNVNGYIIPGWDALNEETYPNKFSFIKKMEKMEKQRNKRKVWDYFQIFVLAVKNGLRSETILNAFTYIFQDKLYNLRYMDRNYKSHLLKLAVTSDIFIYLYKKNKHDISIYYNGAADGVAHYYWRFFEPAKFVDIKKSEIKKYGHVLPLVYRKTDEIVGKILQEANENTTVVIFSNHGDAASPQSPLNRTHYLLNTQKLLNGLGLSDEVTATRMSRVEHLLINNGEREDFKKIIDRLRDLKIEESYQKLINIIQTDEDLKVITVTVNSQSVENEEASVVFPKSRIKIKDLVEKAKIPYSADHDREGIIFIKGKGIKKGYEIKNATILDVAPTILAILGLPVDEAMDGKVLNQIFFPVGL